MCAIWWCRMLILGISPWHVGLQFWWTVEYGRALVVIVLRVPMKIGLQLWFGVEHGRALVANGILLWLGAEHGRALDVILLRVPKWKLGFEAQWWLGFSFFGAWKFGILNINCIEVWWIENIIYCFKDWWIQHCGSQWKLELVGENWM